MNSQNVIEISNVDMVYGASVKTQVLFNVNLEIKRGEFCSIIGQSGSGKSTLLNIIGTLQTPTRGDVIINGQNAAKMNKGQLNQLRNKTIGFVFQNHLLIPEFTAIENVLIPYRLSGRFINKHVIQRAEELLTLTDTIEVKNNKAANMSGGQQQRVAIARALMNEAPIILADEPTGNLDSDTTERVYELMRTINQKSGTTFLIITHDRRIADQTDRIIEIKDGRIGLDIHKNNQESEVV